MATFRVWAVKDKSNKAENVKGVEGALGPGGLRGRVFGAAQGETEGFNSRSWGPPGQTSASRTSAVDLLDAVRQPARGSEGWAVVGGRMIREGSKEPERRLRLRCEGFELGS
jgi:hypothetical protein